VNFGASGAYTRERIIEPTKPMNTNSTSRLREGFTLIEMLVVITIIVILAGLSVGGFSFVMVKQANSQADIQISLLSNALEEYRIDNGGYPDSATATNGLYLALYYNGANATPAGKIYLSELDPLTNKQGWTEGTGSGVKIVDPWGAEYIYRTGASSKNPDFDLASKGKDGAIGTADDIDNY
jgi:general secretion pathway protein G